MKSKISPLIATVTLTVLVLLNSGIVSARACDGCTNRTEIKIPEQAADVLKILHEHDDVLAATVKNKKLSPVSHIVTTMSAYARALPGKAAADRKVAATNAMTSFRTASKGLLRAAIFENQSESAAQTKQLHAALALFDGCFDYKPNLVRPETR